MEKANEQSAKTQSDMIAEIERYKNQLQEVFDKNQSLLDDNNRLNK
jgi:ribosomal protein S17E